MKRAFSFGDKSIEPAVSRVNAVRSVAVIGAGTMGQGIAIDLLQKTDCEVILLDVQPEALKRAEGMLSSLWGRQIKGMQIREEDAKALTARTKYTQSYDDLKGADIIWEVATERSEIKAKIFETIENTVDPERIAAVFSNTSSHTTAELAVLFKSEAFREKFLTVHGYFPFEANRLIDVMQGKYASTETFNFGVVFADQILEKTVIALPVDHHGYITDPVFQAMGAVVSWDIRTGQDIVELGGLWELFTANPFTVLDQTGHMPYTESSRHMGKALPKTDRLRGIYNRDGKHYPDWIARLEKEGRIGVNSPSRNGFYAWSDGRRPKLEGVLDPSTSKYVPIGEISRKEFWSYYEAAERDRRAGKIKSAESLVYVACSDDAGGRAFRRYALPICLYALDLIQDRLATPGQINVSTRAGLRFKVGLVEVLDALISHLTIDGVLELARRARDENADDPHTVAMLDVDGEVGPRKGIPCLLHEMKKRNFKRLLGYGKFFRTPVAQLDLDTGEYKGCYLDMKFVEPSSRDRVCSIVFNNPLRGNVWNRAALDQLAHAYNRVLMLHREGRCGGVLFSAAGSGMRMLGADAREFNRGWFEREKGYVPLGEAEAAAFTRRGMSLFRLIQESPVATVGVFGEKWGGGAEFNYFLDLRYDVRAEGFIFDTLDRKTTWQPKNTYNQPELDYAILGGFGAAGELLRLGLGDSVIFEVFDQGMTADRAYQVGLSNGVFDEELEALRRGYERARLMAKDAPYSRALFKHQLSRGTDDEALAKETGEIFNPKKNPFISTGLLALLDRGARAPKMDYACLDTELPGWRYPADNGMVDMDSADESSAQGAASEDA
ncbi:MAG: 3-hydroxyacyl-CoA dehydrogenase/enoyl-CoA hydratase family protein [Phycisphaerales bacterium]|nr:MAG: 3-hydroxyacyl-CoA dehydrogenase/enoyl-CoA hydratase family protein [Phycisphaerales bacterium]